MGLAKRTLKVMYMSVVLLLNVKWKAKLEIDLCESLMLSRSTNQIHGAFITLIRFELRSFLKMAFPPSDISPSFLVHQHFS